MKKFVCCLLIFQLAACQPEVVPENKTIQVENQNPEIFSAYNAYKTAVMDGNGTEAANQVSSNTIRYYSSLLDLVQNADSTKLALANLLEKFTVLAIRQTVDWGRLRAMDGRELFIHAVENGMIGKDAASTSIGNIILKNETLASVELVIKGHATQKYTNFYREDGRWRVDLVEILKENEKSLKKMMEQPNMSESQCLVLFFKQVFGHEPGRDMWLPVKFYNK